MAKGNSPRNKEAKKPKKEKPKASATANSTVVAGKKVK
jgi:hypothetical protein